MLRAQIQMAVMMATGMPPGGDGTSTTSAGGSDVSSSGGAGGILPGAEVNPIESELMNTLVSKAYGARFAQRRNPGEE